MVDDVLVPMDGSEMSERALEYALEVFPDADVTVLHVVGEPSSMWAGATGLALADDIEESADELAEEVFERAREIAADGDADLDTTVELGHPVRAIVRTADDYDTVVIGSHGGSIADRIFVGNVAEKVFRRSPVPVVVVR
ncbi:universal stress protein [Natronobacterium texcoconense]|uniref:Nucleotide-binding universal stress protein, UspA family n=1 Tax=Natronobacterium texcoconense TaxID=1095778 RepID=A0A1H1I3I0_NATTX|nr:universal stress protein [Natronobacterium texcoconense]SDR32192.1 Nucleotide-binding universal stress protein, UspA family [Natronobacterium texcoconense]